jgi:hypothetical protein
MVTKIYRLVSNLNVAGWRHVPSLLLSRRFRFHWIVQQLQLFCFNALSSREPVSISLENASVPAAVRIAAEPAPPARRSLRWDGFTAAAILLSSKGESRINAKNRFPLFRILL